MPSFRRKKRWLRPSTIVTLLILLMPVKSGAQLQAIYVSPGLQLGYTPDQGVSFSAQATLGVVFDIGVHLIPGVTVGRRWSKQETMTFLDAQLSLIMVGAGVGKVWIEKRGEDLAAATGQRFKAFGGLGLYLTYDRFRVRDDAPRHHFGIIGVLPIPWVYFCAYPVRGRGILQNWFDCINIAPLGL